MNTNVISKAASTVISTVREGAEMGPPALIVNKIVNGVQEFLLKKGVLKQSMIESKLWKTVRNPICVGIVYFSLLLLPLPAGSKVSSLGLTMVDLALKKVSADASEGIGGEIFDMINGIIKDVEKFIPDVAAE